MAGADLKPTAAGRALTGNYGVGGGIGNPSAVNVGAFNVAGTTTNDSISCLEYRDWHHLRSSRRQPGWNCWIVILFPEIDLEKRGR